MYCLLVCTRVCPLNIVLKNTSYYYIITRCSSFFFSSKLLEIAVKSLVTTNVFRTIINYNNTDVNKRDWNRFFFLQIEFNNAFFTLLIRKKSVTFTYVFISTIIIFQYNTKTISNDNRTAFVRFAIAVYWMVRVYYVQLTNFVKRLSPYNET